MAEFETGDLVVLTAGSMRMAVERVEDGLIHTVWCHEGTIGRDVFAPALLRKWESREDDRGGGRAPDRPRPRPKSGPTERTPKGKPGWDGKPREKKYFRKD